ncbi:MAG: SlyX family protein [Pseudomonadota bacterium]
MNDTERLTEVETKLAYLEDTVQTLNDILIEQRNQIDRLESKLSALRESMDSASADGPDDQPPPHY